MSAVLELGSKVGSIIDIVAALAGAQRTPFDAIICVPRQFWKVDGYETGIKEQEAEGHSLDNSSTGSKVHSVHAVPVLYGRGEVRKLPEDCAGHPYLARIDAPGF